ncbi:MAG: response regulator [Bacteroidota bacterium]
MNILIVVETYFVARILRERLEELGYSEIMLATSAPEAVQHLRVTSIDLIIVDAEWLKPGIDIHAFLTSIRKSDEVKSIPILMCSSKNKTEDVKMALNAGASSYLLKPYNEEALKEHLDGIFGVEELEIPEETEAAA